MVIRWTSIDAFNYHRIDSVTIDDLILKDALGDTKLVKETPYDTKLTVAGPTDLADMTGSVLVTDGTGAPGPYSQTPYKLVTTDIESVVSAGFFLLTSNPSNLSDVLAGTPYKDGDALPDGGFLVCVPNREIGAGQVFTDNGSNTGFTATTALGGGFFKADGTLIGNSDANYNANDWTNFNYIGGDPTSAPSPRFIYTGGEVSYFVLNLASGTTGPTVNSSISIGVTALTFPGDVSTNPDLQYFRAGDLVQSSTSLTELITYGNTEYVKNNDFQPVTQEELLQPEYNDVLIPNDSLTYENYKNSWRLIQGN